VLVAPPNTELPLVLVAPKTLAVDFAPNTELAAGAVAEDDPKTEPDAVDVIGAGTVLLDADVDVPKMDPVEIVEEVDPKLLLLVNSGTFEVMIEALDDTS